jgi:hypothetical protein
MEAEASKKGDIIWDSIMGITHIKPIIVHYLISGQKPELNRIEATVQW